MVRNGEKGVAIVVVAFLIPVLLAGLGLVIDNGGAYDMKRRLQRATDAAAIAAAQELRRGGNQGALHAAAVDSAKRNGFGNGTQIRVFNPPQTGPRVADSGFIEVVTRERMPLYFMKAFFGESLPVEARAISGILPLRTCIFALNPTASQSLYASGNAYVDVSQCGVQVNSSSTSAAVSSGNTSVKTLRMDVVGNYSGTGFVPPPVPKRPKIDDPLAGLAAPSTNGPCKFNGLKVSSNQRISPGKYCGGIEVSSGAVLDLDPGTYILAGGGLKVNGGGTIRGDEVTFYNTTSPYAPIYFGGGSMAQLTAPTSGTYKGILFFTDRKVSGGKPNTFTASSGSYYTGTMYFPTTPLLFIGNADLEQQKMLIIANTIEFQGNVKVVALTPTDGISPYTTDPTLVY